MLLMYVKILQKQTNVENVLSANLVSFAYLSMHNTETVR